MQIVWYLLRQYYQSIWWSPSRRNFLNGFPHSLLTQRDFCNSLLQNTLLCSHVPSQGAMFYWVNSELTLALPAFRNFSDGRKSVRKMQSPPNGELLHVSGAAWDQYVTSSMQVVLYFKLEFFHLLGFQLESCICTHRNSLIRLSAIEPFANRKWHHSF